MMVMNNIINNTFAALHFRVQLNTLHLVHDLVVGSSQSHVHGVHQLAELEIGWMSAVSMVTLNLTTNFSSLNCN